MHKTEVIEIKKDDSIFPRRLLEIQNCPKKLYCRGNLGLLNEKCLVSIVGSRKASSYGLRCTRKIARQIAERGVVIVSGLALGIDAEAHRGALEAAGKTIAVLGTAIDCLYPRTNEQLALSILDNDGLIISEYPVGAPYNNYNFPLRNRIIAGLSQITIVTEAAEKSGSLITACLAGEYNREVFAVPADIDKITNSGANQLIKQGASVLTSTDDILNIFGLLLEEREVDLDPDELKVLAAISAGDGEFDKILKMLSVSSQQLNVILMKLELKNVIASSVDGSFYKI
jgi:DNA processing protein